MPAYNAGRYLALSINSVIDQTCTDWELLIVDDASSDNTLSIAQEFAASDSRIRVYHNSLNGGVAIARNRALDEARGAYVAFLDSDDLWEPEKLENQLEFMRQSDCAICYSAYRRINEKGELLGLIRPPLRATYKKMLCSNYIGNLTGIYNADTLGKQYFSDFGHEDYVAWLELIKRAGEARGLVAPQARYRVYSGSTSSNKLRAIGWQWRIYRQSQGIGLLASSMLLVCYAVRALEKRLRQKI